MRAGRPSAARRPPPAYACLPLRRPAGLPPTITCSAPPARRTPRPPRARAPRPHQAADTHQQAAAAAADEGADPMARLTRELEALRRENELLKAQLSELKGGAPASAPAAAPAGAAAGAAAAAAAGVVTAAVGASASAAAAAASAVAGAVAAAVAPAKEAGRARGEPAQQAMAGGPEAFLVSGLPASLSPAQRASLCVCVRMQPRALTHLRTACIHAQRSHSYTQTLFL